MKNLKIFLFALILAAISQSCKEDQAMVLHDDKTVPGAVMDPVVEAIPGGAIVSYTLPKTENLLYVKAEYERNGQIVVSKSSFYKNTVLIEGLGDTREREVKLYAVTRSEVASAPITVKITPLTPPVIEVLNSLVVKESFGGMHVDFVNAAASPETPSNIIIGVVRWNETLKEWEDIDAYYTGLAEGAFSVRGLPSEKKRFGFFVKDVWNNRSDTTKLELTPVYEEELDGKTFTDLRSGSPYPIPQIAPLPASGQPIRHPGNLTSWAFGALWDGIIGNNGFHTTERMDLPIWIPIDMKVKVKLSRYKIWQRQNPDGGYMYSHGNPHEWEIWGSNQPSNVDSWERLDHRVMVKPSGLPLGQYSNDDIAIAQSGHEYEFALDAPAVRYIAFKHIDNWAAIEGATGFLHMSEMKIWGQKQP